MIIPSSFPYCFPQIANSDYSEGGLAAQPRPTPPPSLSPPGTQHCKKGGGSAQFVQVFEARGTATSRPGPGSHPSPLGRLDSTSLTSCRSGCSASVPTSAQGKETQSVVCKQPPSSSGLRQLQPSPPFPRARPLLGPRSPSASPPLSPGPVLPPPGGPRLRWLRGAAPGARVGGGCRRRGPRAPWPAALRPGIRRASPGELSSLRSRRRRPAAAVGE